MRFRGNLAASGFREMRVLLRNADTGLYFGPEGNWVNDDAQAVAFGSSFSAMQAALEFKGQNLELFLSFDNPAFNISFPLRSVGGGGGRTDPGR